MPETRDTRPPGGNDGPAGAGKPSGSNGPTEPVEDEPEYTAEQYIADFRELVEHQYVPGYWAGKPLPGFLLRTRSSRRILRGILAWTALGGLVVVGQKLYEWWRGGWRIAPETWEYLLAGLIVGAAGLLPGILLRRRMRRPEKQGNGPELVPPGQGRAR
ncbi:hypothetical protein [Limnochorda pilosa]|uniref:Uncharacterized protein n=1 Tax=Limnochorda pilosa TaxID=1555112 RepID=A0A0K2SGH5_LIMPI|nr:hypothetical protein [Limnochorda pilosa]BAS26185.1 hypothetical protein LIP_0328 [Limnochorda pilosa]